MADELVDKNGGKAQNSRPKEDQMVDEVLDDCIIMAERLFSVVGKETQVLKEFNADLLLELYPQKEALARELNSNIQRLCSLSGDHEKANQAKGYDSQRQKRSTLKQLLVEIENHNQKNQVFIEGSLSYWQDLLNLFIPCTYAPAQQGLLRRRQPSTKGLALNKEI